MRRLLDAPDLFVYFDDLHWRAGQDIGHGTIWSFDTEIGPDDSVHDYYGMFVMSPAPGRGAGAAGPEHTGRRPDGAEADGAAGAAGDGRQVDLSDGGLRSGRTPLPW